jgi:O-antigen/teichoic acid export membrane protein
MKRSLLFNIIFLVTVNLLIKPFWVFGIDRTVQNQLGEAEYGLYFAIFNFTYLFQILLDFGLQNYNAREVAADRHRINELLPGILVFKTGLFCIYLVICIAVAYPLNYLSQSFIWIILVNQILLSFNIYLRSNISANQYFITDALLSVLDKLLMISFAAVLIWGKLPGLPLTVFNFAAAQLFAYAITFVVCLFFSFRLVHAWKFSISLDQLKSIARVSLPYAVIHFLMTTYYRIDGVMLERMQHAVECGIYAQSYRIMEALNNIGYLLATILLPLFAYRLSNKEPVQALLKSSFSIIFVIAVSIVVGFQFYAFDIMSLLYPTGNEEYSSLVFTLLLYNFLPVALLYVIGTLLTANKNFSIMIPVLSLAVLINVGLNVWLIPVIGAMGAAQATLITQFFILLIYSIAVYRVFEIRLDIGYILRLVVFSAFCVLAILLVNNGVDRLWLPFRPLFVLTIKLMIYFALVPLLALGVGLINRQILQMRVGLTKTSGS